MTIRIKLPFRWIFLSSLLLFLAFANLAAQEQIGLRVGNYSGVHGLALNPASFTTNPGNLSVNLIGGYFFTENNYAFLRNENLPSLYNRQGQLGLVEQKEIEEEGRTIGPNDVVIDYFTDRNRHYLQLFSGIMGPSVVFRTNSGHQFGLTTAIRVNMGSLNFPNPFSYYTYYERPFFEPFQVDPFEFAAASWLEVGFNYAYEFETTTGKVAIGANLKWLRGMDGAIFENRTNFDYTKLPGDSISGDVVNLRFGFTNQNLQGDPYQTAFNGSGGALDIGMVYTAFGSQEKYAWRLGISLLDIGYLQFNRNAELHLLRESETPTFIPGGNYTSLDGGASALGQAVKAVSFDVLGDSLASLSADNFQLFMPMGVSVQLDVSLSDQFYVNGLIMQGVPFGSTRLRRGSLLAVTPRFESKWFDAFLPVSVYNFQQVHVGLAARLGVLTLGSDNLSGLIFNAARLTGTDFYLALHVPFFNVEGGGSLGGGLKSRGKKVRCYEF